MTTFTRYTIMEDIDLSDLQEQVGCVGSGKKWYIKPENNAGKHIALPVTPGEKYVLSSSTATDSSCWCAYLTDSYNPPYTHQSATPHVSGYDRFSVTTTPITITIPEGCAYLALSTQDGNETPNSFTFTLQQYATENAPHTVNGTKCFQVTDTWDGEIDADGIQIDDAYNIDTFQITGNNSTKQLSLLAQVLNIKNQLRLFNYVFSVSQTEYEQVQFNTTIGDVHVSTCYKCNNPPKVQVSSVDGKPYDDYTTIIRLTQQQRSMVLNNIDLNGFEAIYMLAAISNLKEAVLIALPTRLTSLIENGYTPCKYIEGPGKSIIATDLIPTQNSRFGAELQFVTDSGNTSYPRIITAGRDSNSNGLTSSFEKYVTGTLHVSYGNNSSWTVYSNIHGDYNKHVYEFNKNSFYMDGTLVGTGPSTSFTAEAPFTIFGEQNLRANVIEGPGRIYHAYFYNNDTLVADLYPATNSSNIAGLYDVVRDVFFTPSDAAYTIPG